MLRWCFFFFPPIFLLRALVYFYTMQWVIVTGCFGLWRCRIEPVDLASLSVFLSCPRKQSLCCVSFIWWLVLRSHFKLLLMCAPRNLKESVIVLALPVIRTGAVTVCLAWRSIIISVSFFFIQDQIIFSAPVYWLFDLQCVGIPVVRLAGLWSRTCHSKYSFIHFCSERFVSAWYPQCHCCITSWFPNIQVGQRVKNHNACMG